MGLLITDDRQMRGLTGVSEEKLKVLEEAFSKAYKQRKQRIYEKERQEGKRKRQPGGGRKSKIRTMREKLIFLLYYLKSYPTFDALGAVFHLSRNRACQNVHDWMPVLYDSLVLLDVMPHREFESAEKLTEALRGIDTLILDVMERSHQRPKDNETQREMYSGKKKDTP